MGLDRKTVVAHPRGAPLAATSPTSPRRTPRLSRAISRRLPHPADRISSNDRAAHLAALARRAHNAPLSAAAALAHRHPLIVFRVINNLTTSRMNWQSRSSASRPAPSRCSSSSMLWASCQSAGVSATWMRSVAVLDVVWRTAVGLIFMARLNQYFCDLLSSTNLFQAMTSHSRDQAKRPTWVPWRCSTVAARTDTLVIICFLSGR